MSRTAEWVEALRAQGVIRTDAPLTEETDHVRPWFIALLQGVAGWLAGIFLLVFVAMIVEPDSSATIASIGAILLAGAWGLYYADRRAVFLDQFALALSVAGQFAFAVVIVKDVKSGVGAAALLLALQCFIFGVMPNRIARTLAAFFASAAWIYLVRLMLRPGRGSGLFDNGDMLFTSPVLGGASVPVGWLITWAPLVLATWWIVRREPVWMASPARAFVRPLLTGMLLGIAFGGIVTEPLNLFSLGNEQMGVPFGVWSLFPLLSIGLSMYAAQCAFRVRSFGLVGVAIVAALAHLSRFYYLYGTTLTWKSLLMLAIGAVLLLAGNVLRRRTEAA